MPRHPLPVLLGLAGWTAICVLAMGVVRTLSIATPRVWRRGRRVLSGLWGRGMCRLLGIRIRVEGPIPAPPFLLVSNHLSYVDIPVLAAITSARFVSRHDVRGWPAFGVAARAGGTIFIDRSSGRDALRALDALARAIGEGDPVALFPETTTSAGASVLPFRAALLDWAARTDFPVHHAALRYRTPEGSPPASHIVCWWGERSLRDHFAALARLPRIDATVRFGAMPIHDPDRRRLAAQLHEAITRDFIPMDGGHGPCTGSGETRPPPP